MTRRRSTGAARWALAGVMWLGALCPALAEEPEDADALAAWSATFAGPGLDRLVPDGARDLLVVPAGAQAAQSRAAAEVLVASLSRLRPQLPRFAAVLPPSRAEAGDDALVAAAAGEAGADPAHTGHLVVVVRVYPPSAGAAPTATLGLFDRRGARLDSLVAVRGQPLAPPPTVAQPGTPPARPTARDRAAMADQLAAIRAYGSRYIGFRDPRGEDVGDADPFQGVSREPLEGGDLYRALGREDLAKHYRNRQIARYAVIFGGGAVSLAAGIGVLVAGAGQTSTFGCVQREASGLCALYGTDRPNYLAWYAVSGVLFAMVPLSIIAGAAVDPHPISLRAARELVDEHNTGLRARYRVPDSHPDPEPRHDGGATSLWITPTAGPNGGGLAVGGVFP